MNNYEYIWHMLLSRASYIAFKVYNVKQDC